MSTRLAAPHSLASSHVSRRQLPMHCQVGCVSNDGWVVCISECVQRLWGSIVGLVERLGVGPLLQNGRWFEMEATDSIDDQATAPTPNRIASCLLPPPPLCSTPRHLPIILQSSTFPRR